MLCTGYDISMAIPNCCDCGVLLKDSRSVYCKTHSKTGTRNPMSGKYGRLHHSYKGGYIHKSSGYKIVMVEGNSVYEHRLIAEKKLGRSLMPKEIVHHINHKRDDNRPGNLEVMTQGEHVGIHKPMLGKKSKVSRDPITQRFTK